MKKFILISVVLLTFLAQSAFAQKQPWKFTKGSEIKLSIGTLPLDGTRGLFQLHETLFTYYSWDVNSVNRPGHGNYPNIGVFLNQNDTYRAGTYVTGAVALTYTYRFTKWFELSGVIAYSGRQSHYRNVIDATRAYSDNTAIVSAMPFARFVMLNKKYIRIYGGIGMGLGTEYTKNHYYADNILRESSYNELIPSIQLTLFGISVGNKVYGNMEISVGTLGLISCGVGYKF